jgi:CspA family cold shock protein
MLSTWLRERSSDSPTRASDSSGFGFIDTGKGDIFFHSSSLQGVTFDQLKEGQKVSFEEGRGPKGPRAENVTLIP